MTQSMNRLPVLIQTELLKILFDNLLYSLTRPSPSLPDKQMIGIPESLAQCPFPAQKQL